MKKKGLVLFLLSALLFTACGTEKNKTEETDKLTVVTSFAGAGDCAGSRGNQIGKYGTAADGLSA